MRGLLITNVAISSLTLLLLFALGDSLLANTSLAKSYAHYAAKEAAQCSR